MNWFKCAKCFNLFTIPSPETKMTCPICKHEEIENINKNSAKIIAKYKKIMSIRVKDVVFKQWINKLKQ